MTTTFTIPPNPYSDDEPDMPTMLAWPYFFFAGEVGVTMERLDEWYAGGDGTHRRMYLVDVDGGVWVAEGDLDEVDQNRPKPTTSEVREWALATGVPAGAPVSRKGRLRKEIWVAFGTYGGPWPSTFRVVSQPQPTRVR